MVDEFPSIALTNHVKDFIQAIKENKPEEAATAFSNCFWLAHAELIRSIELETSLEENG